MVVGSNLARVKIFTASIGSVYSLYLSVHIYWLSGRRFNMRPRSLQFEPYCLFVCLLIYLLLFFLCYHGSDITACIKFEYTTSGLKFLVTLCNHVRNGFA